MGGELLKVGEVPAVIVNPSRPANSFKLQD